jgi:Family of unknown function (DUF6152)
MTRTLSWTKAALLAAALLAVPAASHAHHSFSMFDATKVLTLKGTVKEFQWSNPHVVIWVYADAQSGPAELWSVELTSPGNLTRQGWTRQQFKAGDKVSVEINPLRDGEHGGGFKQITNLVTGQILGGGRAG